MKKQMEKWKGDRVKEERMKELNKEIMEKYPEEIIIKGYGNLNSVIMLLGEALVQKKLN